MVVEAVVYKCENCQCLWETAEEAACCEKADRDLENLRVGQLVTTYPLAKYLPAGDQNWVGSVTEDGVLILYIVTAIDSLEAIGSAKRIYFASKAIPSMRLHPQAYYLDTPFDGVSLLPVSPEKPLSFWASTERLIGLKEGALPFPG